MDIEVLSERGTTATDAEAKSLRLEFERAVWAYICACDLGDDDPVVERTNEDLKTITNRIAALDGHGIEELRAKVTAAYFWCVTEGDELESDRADESGRGLDAKTSADLLLAISWAFCAEFKERYDRYLNSNPRTGQGIKIARGYLASSQKQSSQVSLAVRSAHR